MDKMRDEFEAWCCKRGYTLKPAETNCGIIIDGAYGHPRVQLAWESWQDSRAALCVELPDGSYCGFEGDSFHAYMCGVESCKDILDEAGVSHK